MAESAGAVHVEFTASVKNVEEQMARGAAAAQRFGEGVKAGMEKARSSTSKSVGGATVEIGKFGDAVKGAPGSITAMTTAVQAFGAAAVPEIRGVSSAVASLLASGFTPLGLAIGALTASFGFLAYAVGEYRTATKSATSETKLLAIDIAKMNDQVEAARRGVKPQTIELEKQVKLERDALREVERRLEVQQRLYASQAEGVRTQTGSFTLQEVVATRELVESLESEALARRSNVANLERQLNLEREVARAASRRLADQMAAEARLFPGSSDLEMAASSLPRATPSDIAAVTAAVARAREKLAATQQRIIDDGWRAMEPLKRELDFHRLILGVSEDEAEEQERRNELAKAIAERTEAERVALQEAGRAASDLADALERAQKPPPNVMSFEQLWQRTEDWAQRGKTFGEGFREGAARQLMTIAEMGERVSVDLANNFTDAFLAFARGTVSATQAFRQFALSVIEMTARMAVAQAILSALSGGAAAKPGGDPTGGSGIPWTGHATGSSFTVGGSGGVDSQLIAFKATPGEMVNVKRPGDRGGGTIVNVHNYSGQQVRTERRGDTVDVMIGAAAADVRRGGSLRQAIEDVFGVRQTPRGT